MSLDVFKEFATDEKKETEGVEIPIGQGATLLIARHENPAYTRMMLSEIELHQQSLQTLPKEEADALDKDIWQRVFATTVLLGWKNLSYKGKPIKYSVDNAKMLLKHPDFRKMVVGHARNIEHFRAKMEAADEKNS